MRALKTKTTEYSGFLIQVFVACLYVYTTYMHFSARDRQLWALLSSLCKKAFFLGPVTPLLPILISFQGQVFILTAKSKGQHMSGVERSPA